MTEISSTARNCFLNSWSSFVTMDCFVHYLTASTYHYTGHGQFTDEISMKFFIFKLHEIHEKHFLLFWYISNSLL